MSEMKEKNQNMLLKHLVTILACFLTLVAVVPVQATTYTVTLTLVKDTEPVWTGVLEVEIPDSTINLTVSQALYDWIVEYFGNDTFEMPFEVPLDPFPPVDPPMPTIHVFTLRVESDPPDLTVVFQPMSPGDPNDDGTVDIIDILIVAVHFGATPETLNYDFFSDVNLDFEIDIMDILAIAVVFGETYP